MAAYGAIGLAEASPRSWRRSAAPVAAASLFVGLASLLLLGTLPGVENPSLDLSMRAEASAKVQDPPRTLLHEANPEKVAFLRPGARTALAETEAASPLLPEAEKVNFPAVKLRTQPRTHVVLSPALPCFLLSHHPHIRHRCSSSRPRPAPHGRSWRTCTRRSSTQCISTRTVRTAQPSANGAVSTSLLMSIIARSKKHVAVG